MTELERDVLMMMEFAPAFERRFRDVRKRAHCLSAEWRYVPEGLAHDVPVRPPLPFAEDAFLTGLAAWENVPLRFKDALKVAFGMGAKSQAERENRLILALREHGAEFDWLVNEGLRLWLGEIRRVCETEDDFMLIFYT